MKNRYIIYISLFQLNIDILMDFHYGFGSFNIPVGLVVQ